MFDISEYIDLNGFQKIGYINRGLKLKIDKLSYILEMDHDLIKKIIDTGSIPNNLTIYEKRNAHEKVYSLLVLFNYILKMAGHDFLKIYDFWTNTSFYDSVYVKPPWYNSGLNNYLIKERANGIIESIKWIAEN